MFKLLVLAATVAGCGHAAANTPAEPAVKPPCVTDDNGFVVVQDGEPLNCDVSPPQILVVMDPLTPCDDMGGRMDGDACVDVDY